MESKWGYQLTQKAEADLDDIVGYIAVIFCLLFVVNRKRDGMEYAIGRQRKRNE